MDESQNISFSEVRQYIINEALRMGTFMVSLLPRGGSPEPNDKLEVHETVLRPILSKATSCRIYGLDYDPQFLSWISSRVAKHKGAWTLVPDPIIGLEPLWNSCCKHNGIVIQTTLSVPSMCGLFKHTSKPQIWSSTSQICEGTSRSAVKLCKRIAKKSKDIAVLIPGSNGIEWIDIFATTPILQRLCDAAFDRGSSTTLYYVQQ